MRLAASGAIRAYKNPAPDDRHCNDFDAVGEALSVDPDRLGGSVKAATVELYTRRGSSDKVIVVAIRGSFIIHDWMVNLNDGAETPVQDDFMGTDGNGNLYAAHSGFLACAKTMKDTVLGNVYRLYSTHFGSGAGAASSSSSSSPGPTLLFTGHSAGGAIAAMLYAHFVNTRAVSGNRAPGLTPRNGKKQTPQNMSDRAKARHTWLTSQSILLGSLHHVRGSPNHNGTPRPFGSQLHLSLRRQRRRPHPKSRRQVHQCAPEDLCGT
jgi:hypothetical protein